MKHLPITPTPIFSYEEELFEHFDYPETKEHKQSHQALLDKVVALKAKFDDGEDNLGPDVLKFLVEWLTKHIMGTDKRYVPFLLAQMEKQRKKMS